MMCGVCGHLSPGREGMEGEGVGGDWEDVEMIIDHYTTGTGGKAEG